MESLLRAWFPDFPCHAKIGLFTFQQDVYKVAKVMQGTWCDGMSIEQQANQVVKALILSKTTLISEAALYYAMFQTRIKIDDAGLIVKHLISKNLIEKKGLAVRVTPHAISLFS